MGAIELAQKPVSQLEQAETSSGAEEEGSCSVCVAVKIRPLVPAEYEQGCKTTLAVAGGQQVGYWASGR